jgi:hypothetical protein
LRGLPITAVAQKVFLWRFFPKFSWGNLSDLFQQAEKPTPSAEGFF